MHSTDFSNSRPVIDIEAALGRMAGDFSILQAIAEAFLEDSPAMLRNLEQSITAGDGKSVHHYAHQIKGSAAMFEAGPVCALALEIENCGRNQTLDLVQSHYEQLLVEMETLEQTLRRDVLKQN